MLTTRASNGQPGWNVARLKRFLPVLGGSRNWKAFGGHCAKGWAEEGDQGKGLSSQSNKGPLAKWWWPDRLLVIRSRWKDLFMDSFQVVFLQAVQSRLTFPVTNKVPSHPGWYQIILGEHPQAGTVAWDKGCYQKFLLSDQSLFLLCSLRRLCCQHRHWPHIPQPHRKEYTGLLSAFKPSWRLTAPLGLSQLPERLPWHLF